MNRKVVVVGTLAVLAGGIWIANIFASKEAEKVVADALYDTKLERFIEYGNVSYNVISGVTSISEMTFKHEILGNEPIKITNVRFSDIEKEGKELSALTIEVEGAVIPVLKIAKLCYPRKCVSGDWAKNLVVEGYQNIPVDLRLSFDGDIKKHSLNLSVSGQSSVIGRVSFETKLEGVEISRLGDALKVVADVADKGQKNGFAALTTGLSALSDIARAFERTELADLNFVLKDNGFLSNAFDRDRLKSYMFETVEEIAKLNASNARSNIEKSMESQGVQRSIALSFADATATFIEEGGELVFKTDIDRPLRIFKQGGALGILPMREFESLPDFLSATKADLKQS